MLYAIVAVIILILDQGLKYWTTTHLELGTGLKELIPGVLHLRNHHNTGSAFSFLEDWAGARWLFLAVTVIFAVIVIWALYKKVIRGEFGRWMAVCVLAGALGNGIDRALHGYVVDMIEFAFFTFPIFNVADIFITVGGILFCLYIILHKEPVKVKADDGVKRGPGGSVVTKPAPRHTETPKREAPKRSGAREATPEPKRHTRRVPAPDRGADLERIQRPAVNRETFAEMARRRPGEDPFAEWMQTAKAQLQSQEQEKTVRQKPEQSAGTAETPRIVHPEVPGQPGRETPAARRPVPEAARPAPEPARPVQPPKSAAEPAHPVQPPKPAAEAPKPQPQAQDVDEDMEFSLEDILNEFRDL